MDNTQSQIAKNSAVNKTSPEEVIRVLLVDPNPTNRKLIRMALDGEYYEINEAAAQEQVLEIAMGSTQPHVILIDAGNIDGQSGLNICRMLKDDVQSRGVLVIVMVDADSNEGINSAINAGADEILRKPIHRGELHLRLSRFCQPVPESTESLETECVVLSLARAVATKDGYSTGHVEQVANFAVQLGEALEMDEKELTTLRYGAILHNVGKVAIPDAILEKTGPLSPRERAMFYQHPRVGHDICQPIASLKDALPIIRHHKEHFDGTGFPDGLRGEQIPLAAQIVGIVDVYSALTCNRPFRDAKSPDEAIQILMHRAKKGMHDPQLVGIFCDVVSNGNQPSPQPSLPKLQIPLEVAEAVNA